VHGQYEVHVDAKEKTLVADNPDPGTATPAEPVPPSPASAEPFVYPTIGTEKITENGPKPGPTTTRGGSGGDRDSRSGS
jgi:hypothetical protein